jgi:hypothetical protein
MREQRPKGGVPGQHRLTEAVNACRRLALLLAIFDKQDWYPGNGTPLLVDLLPRLRVYSAQLDIP